MPYLKKYCSAHSGALVWRNVRSPRVGQAAPSFPVVMPVLISPFQPSFVTLHLPSHTHPLLLPFFFPSLISCPFYLKRARMFLKPVLVCNFVLQEMCLQALKLWINCVLDKHLNKNENIINQSVSQSVWSPFEWRSMLLYLRKPSTVHWGKNRKHPQECVVMFCHLEKRRMKCRGGQCFDPPCHLKGCYCEWLGNKPFLSLI